MPATQNDVDMARKAMIESGILLLKVVFGINAASGLAYFAFLGSVIVEDVYEGGAWAINTPLICFSGGVLFAIFAIYATSSAYTFASLQAVSLHARKNNRASEGENEQIKWRARAIWAFFASIICFTIGIGTILNLVGHVVHPCVG